MAPSADDRVEQYVALARVADTILVAHAPVSIPDDVSTITDDQYVEH